MPINLDIYSLILASGVAIVAGFVGCFALMKRMSLAGDVASHIALPGIGIAILLKINPIFGAAATLVLGMLLIWQLEKKSSLATDTAIGVAFTAAIALGVLITPREDLLDTLFGTFPSTTLASFIISAVFIIGAALTIFALRHKLLIGIFSPELAASANVNVSRTNLIYFMIFALTILLGMQFLGTALVGAMIIAPAAASRQISSSLGSFMFLSALFGVASVIAGFLIAANYGLTLGPTIIAVSAVIFGLTLPVGKK
jgi:ABC-type Mn2+/Zn2+ transport system permease subunit